MTNANIASVFQTIATLLELLEASRYRIRAYSRAADTLGAHHESCADLAAAGKLTSIPGIGDSIAAEIQELLEHGRSSTYDELRAKLPPNILDLLDIQGLGPKRIRRLWKALDITDLPSLEAAARSGAIAEQKGFGAKTQANILSEIERISSLQGRTVIGVARPLAFHFAEYLSKLSETQRVSPAGSLRRGAETVGDLDFVATTEGDPRALMDAFVSHPEVADILAHGSSKSSVRLKSGISADLRVVRPEQWGSALHHFTGSKHHHTQLRARARKMGLKINEYGVFESGSESPIASREEAEVYAALGLPYIPPELREGHGEIEAAEQGALPDLITREALCGDLHMHTTASDGAASIEEMAREARDAYGYAYINITDHSQAMTVANGLSPERMRKHLDAIREADARVHGIRILAGLEVDILSDGSLDMERDVLEQLDFVVASIHTAFKQPREAQTQRVLRAIESGLVHAIGHPTGRLLGSRAPFEIDLEAVIEAAAQHRVALELNANPRRLDLHAVHCRMAREAGVPIIISSDAHSLRGFDVMDYGIQTARRGWLTPADVLNTRELAQLETEIAR